MGLGPDAKSHFKGWAPSRIVAGRSSSVTSVTIGPAVPFIEKTRLQLVLQLAIAVVQCKRPGRDPAEAGVRDQDYPDAGFGYVGVPRGSQNQLLQVRLPLRALCRQNAR